MAAGLSIGWAITLCREAAGLNASALARRAAVKKPRLHNWERDKRLPRPDDIANLDAALEQGGALRAVAHAICMTDVVSDTAWAAHPSSGPIWAWFRAAEATVAHIAWGPWAIDVDVPAGALGKIVTCPIGMPNPPILVTFDAPARFDCIEGTPPPWLPVPVVDGLEYVMPWDVGTHPTLTMLARQLSSRAPALIERVTGTRPGFAAGLLRNKDRSAKIAPTAVPPSGAGPRTIVDGALARRAREATDKGRGNAVKERRGATDEGIPDVTLAAMRSVERGKPHIFDAAATDAYYRLDGRLVCAPVDGAGDDRIEVKFFPFWRGPVWFAFAPNVEMVPSRHAMIEWGGHRKPLELSGACVVTCRQSELDQEAVVVTAPGWHITPGVGRHPDAYDINAVWEISEVRQRRYVNDVVDGLARVRPGVRALLRRR